MYSVPVTDSSLVKQIDYDDVSEILTVHLTFGKRSYYCEEQYFQEFIQTQSKGRFYQLFITKNFKMADRPKTKNLASDSKRFIKMSINVKKLNKAWFHVADSGEVYANLTLQMLPNGELDRYGNLGMITQDVPKKIYEAEKDLPKNQKSQGEILGNGAELDWTPAGAMTPGSETGNLAGNDIVDDLPF